MKEREKEDYFCLCLRKFCVKMEGYLGMKNNIRIKMISKWFLRKLVEGGGISVGFRKIALVFFTYFKHY